MFFLVSGEDNSLLTCLAAERIKSKRIVLGNVKPTHVAVPS